VRQTRPEESISMTRPLVTVVDDDESVRESLPDLLREFGYAARAFSSAEEFLTSGLVDQTRCLILDIAMPGMTGPDLQRELKIRGQRIPIVFVTGMRPSARDCWNRAQRSACSSRSAIPLCSRRSGPRLP
jgi:CheY-like chemotaxis protein